MKSLSYEEIGDVHSSGESIIDFDDDVKTPKVSHSWKFVWCIPFLLFSILIFFLYYNVPALNTEPSLSSSSGLIFTNTLLVPTLFVSVNGLLEVELTVNVCRHNISNTVFYSARCFNGQIPGPTLVVSPGDRIRIKLINKLSSEGNIGSPPNSFRHPNITSLHLHGLHVSPLNENLYQPCYPQEELIYELDIPSNHDIGTFYYHPHYHGSSALQMLGGMAGAIVIQDRNTTLQYAEDNSNTYGIDEGANELSQDIVAILQRLHFNTNDGTNVDYASLSELSGDQVQASLSLRGDGSSSLSGRDGDNPVINSIMVNGQLNPFVAFTDGEMTRLRIIHAGVDNVLALRIRHISLLDKHGTACDCSFLVTARDGVDHTPTTSRPVNANEWEAPVLLAPGSRADITVLCKCADSQGHRIIEETKEKGKAGSILSVFELYSSAGVGSVASELKAYVGSNTPIMESTIMQLGVAATVVMDSGYVFWSFPGERKSDAPAVSASVALQAALSRRQDRRGQSKQSLYAGREMSVTSSIKPTETSFFSKYHTQEESEDTVEVVVENMHGCMEHGASGKMYMQHAINGQLFNVSHIMTEVPLGSIQQWRIVSMGRSACHHKMSMSEYFSVKHGNLRKTSSGEKQRSLAMMDMDDESHPFHLHTNHFQVVHSTSSCTFDYNIGEWRDTITLPAKGNVTIRWVAEDYVGKSVAHCHLFTHADTGMMLNFKIV